MVYLKRLRFFANTQSDKRKFFKIILLFLFSAFIFSFFTFKSLADSSNFNTSFDVTYKVTDSGLTHVIFKGTLTNLTDGFYASSYSIKIGFNDAKNFQASDNGGVIDPKITSSNSETEITLPFNSKVTGAGNSENFTFSFDTNEASSHLGKIWEINLPGFANSSSFKDFNLHILVPADFGKPSFIKPDILTNSGLNFNKAELGDSGISVTFGTLQSFNFNLNYHLENSNLFPIKTEIALPPDTNYQNIELDNLNPKPMNVYEDVDGNWLAQYYLLPGETKNITASGNVLIHLNPDKQILTADDRQIYLRPQEFWEVNNPKIKNLAKSLKTPENIFNYVVSTLSYNYNRANSETGERFGAVAILDNPDQAVCLEFTDLFIAIARAAGIPARTVDGYAYTENSTQRPLSFIKDVLHAWPEYYDDNKQTWIQVDPTWENTTHGTDYFNTFDFDHFAFVINGNSSTYPIPAGGYKLNNSNNHDVNVTFSDITDHTAPKILTNLTFTNTDLLSKTQTVNLTITNVGSTQELPQTVKLSSANILFNPNNFISNPLPPYGTISYQLSANNLFSLTPRTSSVKIQVGDWTSSQNIQILPFFLNKFYLIGGGVILLGILIFIIFRFTL